MIDAAALLNDATKVTGLLVDDLRTRTDEDEPTRIAVRGQFEQAEAAERTSKPFEEWREDLLAQVASSWVLAVVFIRFCEDNGLLDSPLLSGTGNRIEIARDKRSQFFAAHPTAGDREWLVEVFDRVRDLPGLRSILGDSNPLWQVAPSADGAKALVELCWALDADGLELSHDFTDPNLDTRFLGDLYQDLSEHARKQFALLQTPDFIESFILDRTLDPALETFGLHEVKMIDPTCGSGHFLLGGFDRLFARWQDAEPATEVRTLVQRVLNAVNGVDLNPAATAIARFRLLVRALAACDVTRLADAPDFTINVAAGDSLLHGEHLQHDLFGESTITRHFYKSENPQHAAQILQVGRYHAVVGNPPYITVKDPAVRDAVRDMYPVCSGKYALSVPMAQRLHQLAVEGTRTKPAGFVGQITSNSFMKRQMGKKFLTEYLPSQVTLTHVIDTSGAYVPGHGTPTVILLSRAAPPTISSTSIRAVLGIRGEPGTPKDPSRGEVWTAITEQIDHPGSESVYVSVEDVVDNRFYSHPWSLQGGAAPEVAGRIEAAKQYALEARVQAVGVVAYTGVDDLFVGWGVRNRVSLGREVETAPFLTGTSIRDWQVDTDGGALYPYGDQMEAAASDHHKRVAWPVKAILLDGVMFGAGRVERGLAWWEYMYFVKDRIRDLPLIAFAYVATHNHFLLVRKTMVPNRHAPVIKLQEGASEEEHLALLGLLNSSTACFWMKQVFHCKGSTVDKAGARQTTVPFEDFYEFDSTKLKQFPLPDGAPTELARKLDAAAQRLVDVLPAAVAEAQVPTAEALTKPRAMAERLRHAMVALQDELDWECYRLYGLTDEVLTFNDGRLPEVQKGQRAFEIALARRMAAGEATTTWFERHGSTPITEVPEHWPEDYRELVERRVELIGSDRSIRLLEQPEHKRRWNWDPYDDLVVEAQERWLADRIESYLSSADPSSPEPTTVARLADRLARDEDARQVAEDLEGATVDLVKLVGRLTGADGVPYLAGYRLKPAGLRKRLVWERTWDLQRAEDAIEDRVAAGELSESEAAVERKEQGLEKIPVPPKYKSSDYRDKGSWKHRGKLDVPKERFVLYPDVHLGADTTTVVGWAGWDHLQQARALASLYTTRQSDGATTAELAPLLAGIAELVPWVQQWHNDPDPTFGERMGDFFAEFVQAERQALGLSADDLLGEAPLQVGS